jgi:hypothetical protein
MLTNRYADIRLVFQHVDELYVLEKIFHPFKPHTQAINHQKLFNREQTQAVDHKLTQIQPFLYTTEDSQNPSIR